MFSKLIRTGPGRSLYDELGERDGNPDVESRAGLLDEENLNHQFHDYDLEHAEGLGVEDSRLSLGGPTRRPGRHEQGARGTHKEDNPGWFTHDDDGDNDVPASLLVEPHEVAAAADAGKRRRTSEHYHPGAIPGPSSRNNNHHHHQWEVAQEQQRLHMNDDFLPHRDHGTGNAFLAGVIPGNAKKKAEWRWANVSNLDNFIRDVYDYYHGYGIWAILLERFLHLL